MTSRDRVFTAMSRRIPDRVPRFLELCPSQVDALSEHTGTEDVESFFNLDVRIVNPKPLREIPDVSQYLPDPPSGSRIDEWGVAWIKAGFHHFEGIMHPLKDVSTVQEIEDYPFPNLIADYLFEGYENAIARAHQAGRAVRADCAPLGGTILWPAYKLRSMEALLTDIMLKPGLATVLLDRVTDVCCDYARKLAAFDIDVLWLADDYGTQRGLLFGRPLFQKWFKGRLARVVEAAKSVRPDLLVGHHCDGAATDIIPDFIDVGIDILNPVQPECMDPVAIKREFGHDIAFWGTIGTQTTMPFGTPQDVKFEVRRMIREIGQDGGFLIAPTHLVEPEVPWDNLVAFLEAVEEFGAYT